MNALGKYRKAVIAALGAVVLAVGIWRGETSPEFQVIVSVLPALGVYGAPNNAV